MSPAAQRIIAAAKRLADQYGRGRDWNAIVEEAKVPPQLAESLLQGELSNVFQVSFGDSWHFQRPGDYGFEI